MGRRTLQALLIGAAGLLTAFGARAESKGTRMEVTAVVVANCRLTVPPLDFGFYDPLGVNSTTAADASTVLTVTCTRNTAASVAFDVGLHVFPEGDRGMSGTGQDRLRYQIFRDSARSLIWATGGDSFHTLSGGFSKPDQLTVFGRIPPRQEVEPGAYSDVLTAMVDF